MEKLLITVLKTICLHGPVGWAAMWHQRVMRAQAHEWFEMGQMKISDVVPWGLTRQVSAEIDANSANQQR